MGNCAVCDNRGRLDCGTCKSTQYCSAECQAKDFPLHRLLCSKFVPFLEADAPSEKSGNEYWGEKNKSGRTTCKLAIRFPAKSKHPELIWLKCVKVKHDFDADRGEYPQEQSITDALSAFMTRPDGICYRPDRIQIFMEKDPASHEPNECLAFLNEGYTDIDQPHRMDDQSRSRGDIIVAKFCVVRKIQYPTLHTRDAITYANVTLADLRVGFNTLTRNNNHFDSPSPNPYFLRDPFPWMKAVKVREKKGHENSYHLVEVIRAFNIFDDNSAADPISRHWSSAVSVKQIPVGGSKPMSSGNEYIVSRKDGEDVTPKQIEDLFKGSYTADILDKDQRGVAHFRKNFLAMVFPDLEAVKQKKAKDLESWADDVCPRTIDLR
ncbi:uncharacterized protein PAC_19811 [Phialocephala subalpina]|uniref:MYND-type domain-containing protein n=1 Tax=Phialocephala subalpina TaxID=576137 RepID=A0A1L7XXW0_9HELO|nr:uncharacterized protein PAC_19811 [Phialocephala subalpina]